MSGDVPTFPVGQRPVFGPDKVYLLLSCTAYEGDEVIGVFETREGAAQEASAREDAPSDFRLVNDASDDMVWAWANRASYRIEGFRVQRSGP